MPLRNVQSIMRDRLQSQHLIDSRITKKNFVKNNSHIIESIKERADSRVAVYLNKTKTVFGRDIAISTHGAKVDKEAAPGKSLHYYRKNHIQKACIMTAEGGEEDER